MEGQGEEFLVGGRLEDLAKGVARRLRVSGSELGSRLGRDRSKTQVWGWGWSPGQG